MQGRASPGGPTKVAGLPRMPVCAWQRSPTAPVYTIFFVYKNIFPGKGCRAPSCGASAF